MKTDLPPAVLITGASTGIGFATARLLAGHGWRVFAGVRSISAFESQWEQLPGTGQSAARAIQPIPLDVTDAGSLAEAANRVASELSETGLAGLVNNAGIAVSGPLECIPAEELHKQFEVNVLGLIATTQAFLPLLRICRARGGRATIVNISSVSGRVAYPFLAPYAASKHAVEALSDALRIELDPWGIRVVLIEPGPIATPIWAKARQATAEQTASWPAVKRDSYPHYFNALAGKLAEAEKDAAPVEVVSAAIERALVVPRPRARYLVGPGAMLVRLRRFMPDRLWDWLVRRELGKLGG